MPPPLRHAVKPRAGQWVPDHEPLRLSCAIIWKALASATSLPDLLAWLRADPGPGVRNGVAYQRGFQIVGDSTVLQTLAGREEAFKFVHGRGARVWLAWGRTLIGGRTAPFDFAASFQQEGVGRILKTLHGPAAGTWFWTVHTGGARGTVASKDEAVAGVERAFTRLVAQADLSARR